jgi:hypothetical protein
LEIPFCRKTLEKILFFAMSPLGWPAGAGKPNAGDRWLGLAGRGRGLTCRLLWLHSRARLGLRRHRLACPAQPGGGGRGSACPGAAAARPVWFLRCTTQVQGGDRAGGPSRRRKRVGEEFVERRQGGAVRGVQGAWRGSAPEEGGSAPLWDIRGPTETSLDARADLGRSE